MNEVKNTINYKKIYNGSTICFISSHLFLLASLFNYYHNNIIECTSIFILYITSILYHTNGHTNETNINIFNYKLIDEYSCRIVISICIILSLSKYNFYPTVATLFIAIMYYYKIAYTNTLHAILIHLPGSFGFFALCYDNSNNNNSNSNIIISHIFIIWIALIIMSCIYLLYYDFYISYKIKLLNNNITNLKLKV